jgi:hypothetical protein
MKTHNHSQQDSVINISRSYVSTSVLSGNVGQSFPADTFKEKLK